MQMKMASKETTHVKKLHREHHTQDNRLVPIFFFLEDIDCCVDDEKRTCYNCGGGVAFNIQ